MLSRFMAVLLATALTPVCSAQVTASFLAEFDRLKVHTALLAPSSAIDDSPLWSPDSLRIGVNVAGKWYQIDITKVALRAADWHKQRIGLISSRDPVSELDPSLIEPWKKGTRTNSTAVLDGTGNKVEFVRKGLRTALVVTSKGQKAVHLWISDLEACGELSLSPDGRWVAFMCEQNGPFVMDLYRVLRN